MGCFNCIIKIWPDKNFVQGEKNAGGKGREGSFEIKRHPTGFIDDFIYDERICSCALGIF